MTKLYWVLLWQKGYIFLPHMSSATEGTTYVYFRNHWKFNTEVQPGQAHQELVFRAYFHPFLWLLAQLRTPLWNPSSAVWGPSHFTPDPLFSALVLCYCCLVTELCWGSQSWFLCFVLLWQIVNILVGLCGPLRWCSSLFLPWSTFYSRATNP